MHKRAKILFVAAAGIALVGVLVFLNATARPIQVQGGGTPIRPISHADEEPIGRAAKGDFTGSPVVSFNIPEMNTNRELGKTVESALAGMPGVLDIKLDYRDAHADVTFDPGVMGVTVEEGVRRLRGALGKAGLTVVGEPTVELSPPTL